MHNRMVLVEGLFEIFNVRQHDISYTDVELLTRGLRMAYENTMRLSSVGRLPMISTGDTISRY